MYDSERDRNTNKFHYSFYGELGDQENPTLLSDEDLISAIKNIVEKIGWRINASPAKLLIFDFI